MKAALQAPYRRVDPAGAQLEQSEKAQEGFLKGLNTLGRCAELQISRNNPLSNPKPCCTQARKEGFKPPSFAKDGSIAIFAQENTVSYGAFPLEEASYYIF